MKPEELRALHDNRVHGECLATGVAEGVTWEVRQHAQRAPWRPGDGWERPVEVVTGEYRITLALPWSKRLRSDDAWRGVTDDMVVAQRLAKSIADAVPKYPSIVLVGTIEKHPSLEAAVESARSWCRAAARGGYVPAL